MENIFVPLFVFLSTMIVSSWLVREIKRQRRFTSVLVLVIIMIYLVILSLGYCAFFLQDARLVTEDIFTSKLIGSSGLVGLLIGTFVPKIQRIFSIKGAFLSAHFFIRMILILGYNSTFSDTRYFSSIIFSKMSGFLSGYH